MRTNRLLLFIGLGLFTASSFAQAPQGFSYQAVARDQFGNAVTGQSIGVQFVLHQGNALGAVVYAETHSSTTNSNGLFALTVGEGSNSTGTFSSIDWSDGPYFMEVGMDVSSSGSYSNIGTQQLMSVPYALYAGKSNVPDGTEVGQILHWNGNAWVSDSGLYVSNKRFGIGINTPEAPLSVVAGANLAVFNAKRAANFDPGEFEIAFDGPDSTGLSIDEVTDTGNESRLFIEGGTGSVGIGTTAPQAPLAVTSSSSGDVIRFKAPENGAYNIDWAMRFIAPGAPNSGLGITDESSGASQTRLFIADTTGNVGIGTTDPDAALTIRSGNELKQHFQNGDVPTSSDFWNTIDSYGMNTGQGNPDSAHVHLTLQSSTGHLGIGTNDPPAPLAIKSREVLKTYFETGDIPAQDNFGFTSNSAGFGIQQGTPSSLTSRMFIQGTTGFVGIGTITPEQKLHIEDASPSGLTGLKILNTASVGNQGWRMGHLQDTGERDGAFSILEETGTGLLERITVLPSGHVGVNEPLPDTKLHVSRSVSDPSTAINLMEGTGIMTLGPMTDNVVVDHRGLQARHGEYVGDVLNLTTSELNLQRLGGDILIHGDAALSDARKMIITDDGNIGLGILTPVEKLHINGAVVVGDTENAAPMNGTIRYNAGSDELQGVVGNAWTSLGSNWEKVDNTNDITDAIYYNVGSAPRVGIGTTTPDATLQVRGEETCDEGSAAASMGNSSVTLSTSASAARVGLDISCTGVWSSNPEAKNIGLYVSTVSGQSEASSNIAAVMNGNVVVGGITGQQIGTGGTNVLAIQNGAAPAASSGTPTAGIQIYSSELGAGGPSVLHLMTGDGAIVKLYRAPALTPADASAVSSTYDPTTAALIDNMRTRINDLEARLAALGLLTP